MRQPMQAAIATMFGPCALVAHTRVTLAAAQRPGREAVVIDFGDGPLAAHTCVCETEIFKIENAKNHSFSSFLLGPCVREGNMPPWVVRLCEHQ